MRRGLLRVARRAASPGDVIDLASVPQAKAMVHPAFGGEAELFIKGDGRRVFGAHEEFDLVRGGLAARPMDLLPLGSYHCRKGKFKDDGSQ
jgi:hypothetical protein